jgi:hypothetical protein
MVIASQLLQEGQKWTDRIARLALPVLLGTAKAGKTITYRNLAHRLFELHGEPEPKGYRNYGNPIGKIGKALETLAKQWKTPIPPLSAIVVLETSGLPGNGAYWFLKKYLKRPIKPSDRPACAQMAWKLSHEYPKWDAVASYFNIEIDEAVSKVRPIKLPPPTQRGGGPEGEAHKALKAWVKVHPEIFRFNFGVFPHGVTEQLIHSGDRLDVYFRNSKMLLAAEVKDCGCTDSELFRGVFQCVKYRSVLRATQLATGEIENAQAVLVTQRSLPREVVRLAELLNILVLIVELT